LGLEFLKGTLMTIKPFELERYFAKYEFSVKYQLSPSDCESLSLKEILHLADNQTKKMWSNLKLGYTQSLGLPILRSEIAKLYKGVNIDNILTTVPEEGIFIALNCLLNKGDRIICTYPSYQSLYEIARFKGCKIDKWLPCKKNWQFDIDDLAEKIKPNTKMIIFNFPHNPTGYLPPKKDFLKIIKLAKKHNIFVFSDEMYRFLEHNTKDRLPSACEIYKNAISLFGMSKTFGMPGVRTGWLITKNKKLYQKFITFKDYTTICASAPSEILSLIALRAKSKIINRNLKTIKTNLVILDKFFKKHSGLFSWVKPKAGSISFPKILFNSNSVDFCKEIIKKAGVMLAPSTVFDYGTKHFRLGFGRKNMPKAIKQLEKYLTTLGKKI
jgi:aspartate/methionine/tyrosine aminotransferase